MDQPKAHINCNPLAEDLKAISGVGPKTQEALAKAGFSRIFELLLHTPKAVVEELDCPGFAFMEAGRTYVAKGLVLASKITGFGQKKRLEAILKDETGRLYVVFFGPAVNYAQNLIKLDQEITVSGEAKSFLNRLQMVHPKIYNDAAPKEPSNQSKYSQVSGIQPKVLKSVIEKALKHLGQNSYNDHLAERVLEEHSLSPLAKSLFAIHHPTNSADWDKRASDPHYNRLAFEELLSFYVGMFRESRAQETKARAIRPKELAELCTEVLPFELTEAQKRAFLEIMSDMSQGLAMSRLLQGDVGSGKTAVSALAALLAFLDGSQTAVLAPTEILAEQLYGVYQSFLTKRGAKIAFLSASTKTKERRDFCQKLVNGEIDIAVGTHALLSEDIRWKALNLVIIDEQHRFGVKQRAALLENCRKQQGLTPHLLVMSATPIPRSLALTLYGDLDLSVINEKPPGRLPIATKILSGAPISSLQRLGERIVLSKQKAFVVFPLVEESEHLDLEDATKAAGVLKELFGADSCLLLHGRMSALEKNEVMNKFKNSSCPFLVSTTVIEVGVDIPDASCMVIVHPERFGLAQLHQLRGRVGRGKRESFCFLLSDIKNRFSTTYKRLNALCHSENGFELAQIDLDIRGPGELLGTRQAGLPNFHIFNHSDFGHLVDPAKKIAKEIAARAKSWELSHLYPHEEAHFS